MSRVAQYNPSQTRTIDRRASFLVRTYLHLAGAIGAFVALEYYLLNLPGIENLVSLMLGTKYSWLMVLGIFMVVSAIAEKWAYSRAGTLTQYLGLGLYIVAEAVIFVPLLYIASSFYPDVIPQAAMATGVLFTLLTLVVLITRKNFSFMKSGLIFGGMVAMGLIVASVVLGFTLGPIFTYAMIAFACLCILYHTSDALHHCGTDQHVGAALALFASVALLFWYVVLFFLNRN